MEHSTLDFIIAVLTDDHGISREAYNALWSMYEPQSDNDLYRILQQVDAVDDRFFLPEDFSRI
jgi:hypothetical protein